MAIERHLTDAERRRRAVEAYNSDAVDEHGVVKDGAHFIVPMFLKDAIGHRIDDGQMTPAGKAFLDRVQHEFTRRAQFTDGAEQADPTKTAEVLVTIRREQGEWAAGMLERILEKAGSLHTNKAWLTAMTAALEASKTDPVQDAAVTQQRRDAWGMQDAPDEVFNARTAMVDALTSPGKAAANAAMDALCFGTADEQTAASAYLDAAADRARAEMIADQNSPRQGVGSTFDPD